LNLSGVGGPALIDINSWLSRSTIASKISWQSLADTNPYTVTDSELVFWQNWTASQKSDLQNAFAYLWEWFYANNQAGDLIPTIPINIDPNMSSDNTTAFTSVSLTDGWNIYVNWLAHTLFLEAYQIVPWSISSFDDQSQFQLLSSSRMMSRSGSTSLFILGTGGGNFVYDQLTRDSREYSIISSPIYTYKFLIDNQIYVPGQDRIGTIKKLLDWCRNLTHFYGQFSSFKDGDDYWQYRGAPPVPKIISGTTGPAWPYFAHWTGGCHGTGGFLQNVLRALNIPVELSLMGGDMPGSGHQVPIFRTENVFLSHGDDPYNLAFRDSKLTTASLLVPGHFFKDYYGVEITSNLNNGSGSSMYLGFNLRPVNGYVGTDARTMLAGAQLTFTNTQTSFQVPQQTTFTVQTDAHGYYNVTMMPGTYNVTVVRPGSITIQTQITHNNWPETFMFPSSLPCPPPTNLMISDQTINTAILTWTDPIATNNYEVDISSGNQLDFTMTSTNSITVQANEGASYTATAKNFCGSVASAPSSPLNFTFSGQGGGTSSARVAADPTKTGSKQLQNQEVIAIYPNPVHDVLKLSGVNNENQTVVITDMLGREVYNGAAKEEIEVGGLQPGMYLLVLSGNTKKTFKFVKQ
jgi:hypothetical protein